VTTGDREHWDERYLQHPASLDAEPGPHAEFSAYEDHFPTSGYALDLACGRGDVGVWLASRGLHVLGVDVSPVAIERARQLAGSQRVAGRCTFKVFDLDVGLPAGPRADVIHCRLFRDSRLDKAIIERLAPGGLLAIVVLSEVGAGPGSFRAAPGELTSAFRSLTVIGCGEADGRAWLLARR